MTKLVKNGCSLFTGNSDSSVSNGEFQEVARFAFRGNDDTAAFGSKFDGIGKQVRENLLDFCLVLKQGFLVLDSLHIEVDIFFLGEQADHVTLSAHDETNLKLTGFEFHFAGFELCQVQDVIDHFQQYTPRRTNVLGVAALFFVERVDSLKDIRESDDTVQRRT